MVVDGEGNESVEFSSTIRVPDALVKEVLSNGSDLGLLMIERYGSEEKEVPYYFTGGVISRKMQLEQALIIAISRLGHE